jgi:hypothetical protein
MAGGQFDGMTLLEIENLPLSQNIYSILIKILAYLLFIKNSQKQKNEI